MLVPIGNARPRSPTLGSFWDDLKSGVTTAAEVALAPVTAGASIPAVRNFEVGVAKNVIGQGAQIVGAAASVAGTAVGATRSAISPLTGALMPAQAIPPPVASASSNLPLYLGLGAVGIVAILLFTGKKGTAPAPAPSAG